MTVPEIHLPFIYPSFKCTRTQNKWTAECEPPGKKGEEKKVVQSIHSFFAIGHRKQQLQHVWNSFWFRAHTGVLFVSLSFQFLPTRIETQTHRVFFPTATSVGKNDDGSRHLCWIEINLINSARIYPEIALFVTQLKNTNDEKVTTTKCSIWQKFLIHSSIPVRCYSFCRVFISQKSTSQTHSHRNFVHLSNLTMVRERISIDRQTKQQQKE